MASGHYYRAGPPTAAFPAAQRASLIPQQQVLLRRQQLRGSQQQQQQLPPLEGEKNVITLYSSVITATIQRCAKLQNAKVLEAIERHWRMALQRRTAELRRSSSSSFSSASASTSRSRGERQQKSGVYGSSNNTSSSSRGSNTNNAAAVAPRAAEKQVKSETSGVTASEAVTASKLDNKTHHPSPPHAAEQKHEQQHAGTRIKSEEGAAAGAATEISPSLEKIVDVKVKQEQLSPAGGSQAAEATATAAPGAGRGGEGDVVSGSSSAATITGRQTQQIKEEEEDDEFADADVDEAKPPAEPPTMSVSATREDAAHAGTTGSADETQTTGDTLEAETAASFRDTGMQHDGSKGSAKTTTEHAEGKPGSIDLTPRRTVEPLDIEQPENLDEVSDIDDQEPPTTDGIFALYEKVQRCGSSGRKATNWKVTLRHGIIRVAHQEIAFDRLHAELKF